MLSPCELIFRTGPNSSIEANKKFVKIRNNDKHQKPFILSELPNMDPSFEE